MKAARGVRGIVGREDGREDDEREPQGGEVVEHRRARRGAGRSRSRSAARGASPLRRTRCRSSSIGCTRVWASRRPAARGSPARSKPASPRRRTPPPPSAETSRGRRTRGSSTGRGPQRPHHEQVTDAVAETSCRVREEEHPRREEGGDQDRRLARDALGLDEIERQKEDDGRLEIAVGERREARGLDAPDQAKCRVAVASRRLPPQPAASPCAPGGSGSRRATTTTADSVAIAAATKKLACEREGVRDGSRREGPDDVSRRRWRPRRGS